MPCRAREGWRLERSPSFHPAAAEAPALRIRVQGEGKLEVSLEGGGLLWRPATDGDQLGSALADGVVGGAAQLRDLLAAEHSPVVTEEDQDNRLILPEVSQALGLPFRIEDHRGLELGRDVLMAHSDLMASPDPERKLPILLFDVMGTLVHDPFYEDVPAFFGTTLARLIEDKHPSAWLRFELGEIDEAELERIFFADGRTYDHAGMKAAMQAAYAWLPGMEELLSALHEAGYEMHALSNYPEWWRLIEEKLAPGRFLEWSFVSCDLGVRKPDSEAYGKPVARLDVAASDCLFVDDRTVNVEAARREGLDAILFQGADDLERELGVRGVTPR